MHIHSEKHCKYVCTANVMYCEMYLLSIDFEIMQACSPFLGKYDSTV